MKKTKNDDSNLISYCGICCSLCPPFRNGDCSGCLELDECKINQCAKSKKIRYCFSCKEFPCELFEKGFDWDLDVFPSLKKFSPGVVKWKPFSNTYIQYFKMVKKNREK